jgi:parallel beta-helix repeat protein
MALIIGWLMIVVSVLVLFLGFPGKYNLALLILLVIAAVCQPVVADPVTPAPYATVRDFGAVGDGQTDDSAAIQQAVDAVQGAVRFNRGVYRITKPIVVELNRVGPTSLVGDGTARILMAGPGPAIKLLGNHGGTADPATVAADVWQRQRMPIVDGLEIVGAHPDASGIEADGTMQLTVTRVNIRDCRHGIHLVRRNRNVLVADCHLYHNRGVGLYLDDVDLHQINISNCHISYNMGGGIVSRAGGVRNLHITGCDIESNMSPQTPPTANVLIDGAGSTSGTAEVAVTGCTLQHNTDSPESANIRFRGGGKPDHRWGHLTIANNILSDVTINVDIQNARGVSLIGNSFGKAARCDLRIVASANVVIGPNMLERNPNYKLHEQSADGGVLLQNCQDMTISGLHITEVRRLPAGLVLENCRRVNINGCSILDCENAGILLKEVSNTRVSGCLIRNDLPARGPWSAIKTEAGSDNLIEK